MNILVINCGSSSIKYQLVDAASTVAKVADKIELNSDLTADQAILNLLKNIQGYEVAAVGHRVVHGGDTFRDAVVIDDDVIKKIEEWIPVAPLHNRSNLAGIRAAMVTFTDIPHVAVFDTAFHATLPRRAYHYAIDTKIAARHHIRRFGFHGTSHQFVAQSAAEYLQQPLNELRIISLHLGNGASACAVEFGRSTETSMGMTPLEGLMMGNRSGDIDPGVIIRLLREKTNDVEVLDTLLNKQSGLKGLSGISNDVRVIERAAEQGDDNARLALNVFAHRAKKYIGAYAAIMGGVDAIVLTGGIGENSASIRKRILQRLNFLGVCLDEDLNNDAQVSHSKSVVAIHHEVSRVKLLVVKTNEELMIAQQTLALMQQPKIINPGPIPIAVSARHIHLDEETFATLFGADAKPTHKADLSQPGQFACEETVNLIGPRNIIEGVRLLGPFRARNQIEISRTDEFYLGVDAPVRDSGKTKDSAPIIVEGPNGSVSLSEGLICARRHIHMTQDDAKRFGVKNREEVEVAISGGERDLIFADVLIRISPNSKLEMHIDTDEANAAELGRTATGELVYTDLEGAKAEIKTIKTS
jgi:acetate kinase